MTNNLDNKKLSKKDNILILLKKLVNSIDDEKAKRVNQGRR